MAKRTRFLRGTAGEPGIFWSLPVIGETYDGWLNDINGFHVKPEHAFAALDSASDGPVTEGAVGGGTGMICHEFKGGIGTSSRIVEDESGSYTIGVLVQANYGVRDALTIAGVPVGKEITDLMPSEGSPKGDVGSIIVIRGDRCTPAATPAQANRPPCTHGHGAGGQLCQQQLG